MKPSHNVIFFISIIITIFYLIPYSSFFEKIKKLYFEIRYNFTFFNSFKIYNWFD